VGGLTRGNPAAGKGRDWAESNLLMELGGFTAACCPAVNTPST